MGEVNMARVRSLISERNSASKRATLLRDERDILKAENARLRAQLEAVRDALKKCRDELTQWGWGDLHYGETPQDPRVVAAVAMADAALSNEGRDDG